MHTWLNQEHVRRWWRERQTLEQVEADYGPAIDGTDPTRMFVIEVDGRSAGLIQTYLCDDYPEWIGPESGAAGVDLFIGEEELLGLGLGPGILVEFMRTVVFADPSLTVCLASPEPDNARSVRAFEKAGFKPVREIRGEYTTELLMRVERENVVP